MLRVLCLDGEGGWGGSSRSLAKSLQYIDRDAVSAEVWCRRAGPIQDVYKQLKIRCRVMPQMPASGAVPRASRNLASQALAHWRWWKEPAIRADFLSKLSDVDVVHFNIESQWWLANRLRGRHCHAQTMHVRTNAPANFFSRRQSRIAAGVIDRFVFITEHERCHFEGLVGRAVPGQVIYNIADREKATLAPAAAIPLDQRLRIGVLANFTWPRGHDRLVDIAEVLAQRGNRHDFLFVVAGDLTLAGHLEGKLLEVARRGGTFSDYVGSRGLEDMFLLLGHVSPPEAVLAGCDVVASPKRVDNPWGRDVIEALAFGRPVVSTGMDNRFVEDGATGFLLPGFDPELWADRFLTLHRDRPLCRRLGSNGAARVARLCDGKARAADLLSLWQEAIAARKSAS